MLGKYLTPKENSTKEFEDILPDEHEWIRGRRKHVENPSGNPSEDAVGLALSGGGVRSATFNLGLLQAMDNYNYLKWVDYLSTVSGGGYIGSSLSWYLSRYSGKFPFKKTCEDEKEAREVRWLRQHSCYLTPGNGLDNWALGAAIIRGIFMNLLIFIPVFIALFYALTSTFFFKPFSWLTGKNTFFSWPQLDWFPILFIAGIVMLGWLIIRFFLYAVLSRSNPIPFNKHRKFSVHYGKLLKYGTLLSLIGFLPIVDAVLTSDALRGWRTEILSSLSITGTLSLIAGWIGRKGEDETRGYRAFLLRLSLILILFVLLLWGYHLSMDLHLHFTGLNVHGLEIPTYLVVLLSVLFSLIVGIASDINHVSMHRYYRDRLLETYMPGFQDESVDFSEADKFFMKDMDITKTGAPYQIVNTVLSTLGSTEPKLRSRGGDSFIFSPLYVGSKATDYIETSEYIDGKMSLATALSISGAAVDPNTGVTRSRPLAFLMTLLNVRLGYWLINPKFRIFKDRPAPPAPPFWHYYALREMLGWNMDEKRLYVRVSDGGHFENLGLYELVRRRCPYIIVSDAGADPDWSFADLARACERVRADFCAEVYINTQPLHPDKEKHLSDKACIKGKIVYEDGFVSKVLFLKTTVKADLSEDIYGYKRDNEKFPDESTADQFFDEVQFEAYRELGYQIGTELLVNWNQQDPRNIF